MPLARRSLRLRRIVCRRVNPCSCYELNAIVREVIRAWRFYRGFLRVRDRIPTGAKIRDELQQTHELASKLSDQLSLLSEPARSYLFTAYEHAEKYRLERPQFIRYELSLWTDPFQWWKRTRQLVVNVAEVSHAIREKVPLSPTRADRAELDDFVSHLATIWVRHTGSTFTLAKKGELNGYGFVLEVI